MVIINGIDYGLVTRAVRSTPGYAAANPALARYFTPIGAGAESEEEEEGLSDVEKANAKAQIQGILEDYGLGSLAGWAYGLMVQGYSIEYVLLQMRDRPEFKERFPAIEARKKAGLTAISPAEYVRMERAYDEYLHAAGLTGMYDRKKMYTTWISGDVSPLEVKDRAEQAYRAAMSEPLEVRQELTRLFGVGAGGAAIAYFLDPKNALPKLTELLQSGGIAGGSIRAGYGLLTAAEATRLTQIGISTPQAQQGFGELAKRKELFAALPGEFGYQSISRAEQFGAAFEGDAADQQRLERAGATRAAVFGSGARYRVARTGVGGLGTSNT